jgi:methylenetetrahydrofolate dehydrogenase (NAD+)
LIEQCELSTNVWIPCTALSVYRILNSYHEFQDDDGSLGDNSQSSNHENLLLEGRRGRWSGVTISIINRSEIFGRPLAALLALDGAVVYSIDDKSILVFTQNGRMRRCGPDVTVETCLRHSSVVVTGVPNEDFRLPCAALARLDDGRSKCVSVVNISEFPNVSMAELQQAGIPKPVKFFPHVGKVTVAALEENFIRLHRRSERITNNDR